MLGVDAEQETLEDVAEPLSATPAGPAAAVTCGPRVRSLSSGTELFGLAEREADAIVAVLRREGPLDGRTLRAPVSRRGLWGPGRFGPALRRAVRDGRVRRVGRRTWAAVD